MVAANDLASVVLPVPGTSSSNRWPSDSRQISDSRIASGLPTSAWPMASTTASNAAANAAAWPASSSGEPVPSKVCTNLFLHPQAGIVVPAGANAAARYHLLSLDRYQSVRTAIGSGLLPAGTSG